ncbi:angiopoietin-related protein 3 [Drosophila obscura]|uniref:angiopoietin-related protein 3 n=1 Tax=Drosophila obscura TaxID=7282 RepID=UPI001BB11151|nr:angiopoietin-related protein 3 [Drosophila obscura]
MNNLGFVAIICLLLLQGNVAKEITFQEQCNGYCFSVVQPFLDSLVQLKEATDANNEIKDKIHSLELTINNLQSQLVNSGTEIKIKDEQMKDLREQIKDKNEQIKRKDEQIQEKDKQLKEKDEQIKGKEEQILRAEKNYQLSKFNQTTENLPDTCPNGGPNGIFQIKIKGMEPFQVPCDSHGWTVIQRRIDGSVDFNRNWTEYKEGFGDMRGEFFIGLEKLHFMTAAQPHELYIQLRDVNGTYRHARYDNFIVGSEEESFILKSLGEYSGNAGDSLKEHKGAIFYTLDRDSVSNCVRIFSGPWWFDGLDCGRR